jgi:hypothetical protein
MKKVLITASDIERAKSLYDFGALRDSITQGRSNIYGALGEVLFSADYSLDGWRHQPSRDYDFIHPHFGTVDVKTKRTTATPQSFWNCSVAGTSTHQKCDYYFFIRIHESLDRAWMLGWLPRDEFFQRGVYRKKGDLDETSDRGWRYRADCWNVRVDGLRPLRAL